MVSRANRIRLQTALVTVATMAACGGGYQGSGDQGGSGPNPGEPLAIEAAGPTGNNQSGFSGGDLPMPVRIVALRGGVPAAGEVVVWSASGAGARMTPSVDTTGADGISTSVWHLGSDPGPQSAQAALAEDAIGAPVSFSATALDPGANPPGVTIQLRSGGGNRFVPANVTIPAGTTVTWTWVDGVHNVNHEVFVGGARDQARSGAPVNAPAAYSFRFITPGTYAFFCEVHGTLTSGMHGTIEVR